MLLDVMFGEFSLIDAVVGIIASLVVVFLLLPVHEFAHAFVAVKLGDKTPKWQGRLTLNPLAHVDYMGAAALILIGFGWARPVQVNMNNFKNPKRDMALVALAGPVSNIIMALGSLLLCNIIALFPITSQFSVQWILYLFFINVAYINITLAVFNFIPIPPLDGSRLLNALLPDRIYYKLMEYERYSFFIILALVYFFNKVGIFGAVVDGIFDILNWVTYLPFSFLY